MLIELNAVIGEAQDDLEQVTETTALVIIDTAEVREFYPRRHGRQGTRIVFKNGAGCPVADLYPTVKALMATAVGHAIASAPELPVRALRVVQSEEAAETVN